MGHLERLLLRRVAKDGKKRQSIPNFFAVVTLLDSFHTQLGLHAQSAPVDKDGVTRTSVVSTLRL